MEALSRRAERGFTVLEMLVATTITMAVTAAIFSLMHPAQGVFSAQPEASDMQQRLRVGVETLHKDLLMAGAGTYSAEVAPGPLVNVFAPILPARVGKITPDPPGMFRTDRLTVMYVPQTPAQTRLSQERRGDHPHLHVTPVPGCRRDRDVCGIDEGMHLINFDGTGQYDALLVTGDGGDGGRRVTRMGRTPSKSYPKGSFVSQFVTRTYYLSIDSVAETSQLRQYDGFDVDVPVVDNVVGLEFVLYGETQPARLRRPVTEAFGPWTTYGPKPPALGVNNADDTWPAGENCAFGVAAGQHVPRMATLAAPGGLLVRLDQANLTDGPWCPDEVNGDRYDVDLLRVRRVGVSIRVQVANEALRGPAGPLFTRGGTAAGGERFIPDHEIRFDVTPRNLNLGR